MKIIFMGTPDFAVPCLKKLISSDNEVVAVFSQPDKPVGRKQVLTPPPVKVCAAENNIPVYQPVSLKDSDAIELINGLNADLIVVVAYGKILPEAVLNSVKYGCINVHASLLPKYRGAAPIQWAILNGDSQTGVAIQQMNEGIDTGDILLSVKTDIDENETSAKLFDRLALLGAEALLKVVDNIELYQKNRTPQPVGDYGYAKKITKELSPIDWNNSAFDIHNQIRGLQTWPCARTLLNGKNLKVHKSVLSSKCGNTSGIIVDNKGVLTVCCGDGKCIDILEVQPDGKKKMDIKSYLAGNPVDIGTRLGE